MTNLKKITPLGAAPYALRFIDWDTGVLIPGVTRAVDFRYKLSTGTFEAVVTRYESRETGIWRHVEAAREIAEVILADVG
jgi:hypothetical protein